MNKKRQPHCHMKTSTSLFISILLLTGFTQVGAASNISAQPSQSTVPSPTPYVITAQDGNSRTWERTEYETDPSGQVIARKHQYNEVASGLNHLVNGQWVESKETIDILPNGTAAAINGQHKAYFPGDIYDGQIEMVTPDGKHLKSRPLGLNYFDGQNTVLIAELTNSTGVEVGDNVVIYPNAFAGLKADLRYTYTKAGFEQDIILRQQPPTPESYGLNPDTARLQVLTEFFAPPQPSIRATRTPSQAGLSLEDQSLGFGAMQMIQGRAFALGQKAEDAGALVSKHWLKVRGRQFLLEEVPVNAIVEGLAALPLTAMNTSLGKNRHTASKELKLPRQHLAKNTSKSMLMATADMPVKGFVMDYQTVVSSTNYTFQGDTTYYVSGSLTLYGTNIFEGGAVIKYNTNATISINPAATNAVIIWKADMYRPVVFTAKDDDTCGEILPGSSGHPTGYYGNPMLSIASASPVPIISGLRMSYANTAFSCFGVNANVYNAQFVNCQNTFTGAGTTINLLNALIINSKTNFSISGGVNIYGQNITFSSSKYLVVSSTSPSGCNLVLTNCIFANITNLSYGYTIPVGSYNGFYNTTNFGSITVTNSFYPFQTVAGGDFYLTNGCAFTNAGTTIIDPTLLTGLKQRTTYPPISYTNISFTNVTTFYPQALRDIDTPDLGYHYDPLDYDFGGCFAYSNLTFTAGTAVGWFRTSSGWSSAGYGINMKAGVTVSFAGTVAAPTYWVRLNTVQEQDYTAGYGQAGIETWVTSNLPWVKGQFLKCSMLAGELRSYFSDDGGTIQASMVNSEFWGGNLCAYGDYRYFTNCLMARVYLSLWNGNTVSSLALRDCTFIGGYYEIIRNSSGPTPIVVRDTAFDRMTFSVAGDYYNTTAAYTTYDYDAYTNTSYPFYIGGTHDVIMTNGFVWQSNWLGDYYEPTNSLMIDKGSTSANYLGLYHFTTQTNQVKDGNSTVDIGYHYVAVNNTNGVPIDSNGDGIPDYIQDTNGNGVDDPGESPWDQAFLNVTNYGVVGDATNFVAKSSSNPSYFVATSIQWPTNGTIGKVIEVFNSTFDASKYGVGGVAITNGDIISLITNVTYGTNLWFSVPIQKTGSFLCTVGTNNSAALQSLINLGELISGTNGVKTTLYFPKTGQPTGRYLAVSPHALSATYQMTSAYDDDPAVSIWGGGLVFAGEPATLLNCGAGMTRYEQSDAFYTSMRGTYFFVMGPSTNQSLGLTFTNLIFDGGVTNGYAPYLSGGLYFPPDAGNGGWDATHDAITWVGSGTAAISPVVITNCGFAHWRGEVLKNGNGNGGGAGATQEVGGCWFTDGSATCLNLGHAQIIHHNVFTNIYELQEFYREYTTGPSYFYSNYISGSTANTMIALNGSTLAVQPYYIFRNTFSNNASNVAIEAAAGANLMIVSNSFLNFVACYETTSAGYQPSGGTEGNENVTFAWNTISGAFNMVSLGGAAPNYVNGLKVTNNLILDPCYVNILGQFDSTNVYCAGNTGAAASHWPVDSTGFYSAYIYDDPSDNWGNYFTPQSGAQTNAISYAYGWNHHYYNSAAGGVLYLDDSNPDKIPAGAKIQITSVGNYGFSVYFKYPTSPTPDVVVANYGVSPMFYWHGTYWNTTP